MEIPEYGNKGQVIAAVKAQEAIIQSKLAEVDIERAKLKAIRTMCPHDYSTRYSMGRDAGEKCDICGDWR